ncbi:hypothetical protein Lumi_098 [Xylophilus phage Lumi]|nr:hypothetical protein Lumi_098 [Xylophilus phage Lumi]
MEQFPERVEITSQEFIGQAMKQATTYPTQAAAFAQNAILVQRKFLEPALQVEVVVNGKMVELHLTPGGCYKAYMVLD